MFIQILGLIAGGFVVFAICGVARTDNFFQTKFLKILSKKLGEVAPLWIITGQ